jgi:hypothetical protein
MAEASAAALFSRAAVLFFSVAAVGSFAREWLLRFLVSFYLLFEKFGNLNFIV